MKKKLLTGIITLAAALVCTVGFATANKQEANACSFFKRVSVKKCAMTLSENNVQWDGTAKEPQVRLNYKGEDLEQGKDFVVEYRNNIDAGTATVKVKGKGDYRGSQKMNFNIQGINFSQECIVEIDNGKVNVYYKGEKLSEGNYSVYKLKNEKLKTSVEGVGGSLNTYDVTTTYVVSGKGEFEGSITKVVESFDVRFE